MFLGIGEIRLRANLRTPPLELELGGLTKTLLLSFTCGFLGLIKQQPVFLELLILLRQLLEVGSGLRLGAAGNVDARGISCALAQQAGIKSRLRAGAACWLAEWYRTAQAMRSYKCATTARAFCGVAGACLPSMSSACAASLPLLRKMVILRSMVSLPTHLTNSRSLVMSARLR